MKPSPKRAFRALSRATASRMVLAVWMASAAVFAQTPLQHDWHTYVDERGGIAIDLPPTHAVGATDDGAWYVHGFVDGDPTVPDMSIILVRAEPGAPIEEILGAQVLESALVERVYLGRGVPAWRVTAEYETFEGRPYVSSLYVVPVTEGAYVISRYENFDWRFFEHVALSFRFVK